MPAALNHDGTNPRCGMVFVWFPVCLVLAGVAGGIKTSGRLNMVQTA
ncbi:MULTISPECIES: hypothetical protein [unclassified Neisseria]|nr:MULTISPECIES: hypothetical protein [unclassified Neisseria]MBF0803649.1 hypothetical protein [Neisseria sp. 19428wB4_WF04]